MNDIPPEFLFCVIGPGILVAILLAGGGKMRGPRIGDHKRKK